MLCDNVQPQASITLYPDVPSLFIMCLFGPHLTLPVRFPLILCHDLPLDPLPVIGFPLWDHGMSQTPLSVYFPCFSSLFHSASEEFILCPRKVIILSWLNETHHAFPKSSLYFTLGLKILKTEPSAWKQGMEKGRKSSWRKINVKYRLGFLKMLCSPTAHDLLHFSYFLAEIFMLNAYVTCIWTLVCVLSLYSHSYLSPTPSSQNNYFIILQKYPLKIASIFAHVVPFLIQIYPYCKDQSKDQCLLKTFHNILC